MLIQPKLHFKAKHFHSETAKKWNSRFIHSEKRIKKHFVRYVCDWDYIEPPHGEKAMNTEQKRAIALGGYDKVKLVILRALKSEFPAPNCCFPIK